MIFFSKKLRILGEEEGFEHFLIFHLFSFSFAFFPVKTFGMLLFMFIYFFFVAFFIGGGGGS